MSPPLEEDEPSPDEPFGLAAPFKSWRKPGPVDTGAASRLPHYQSIMDASLTKRADKPYVQPGPLTPGSYRSNSPRTPYGGLPMNPGNDAMPTPSSTNDRPAPSPLNARRANGYGGLGDASGYTTDPPASPGPGMMKRMDTITPGPFDHRRPSGSEAVSPLRNDSFALNAPFPEDRPTTANSNRSGASGDPAAPPRMPRRNDYEGFGPPSRLNEETQTSSYGGLNSYGGLSPYGGLNRSETFPAPSFAADLPSRTPSAPGQRFESSRQSQGSGHAHRPSMGPDTSRRPPPRKSLIRPARENQGSVDLAREFGIGNPYHTPSDSASSEISAFSQPSYPSSQTSPARSQARGNVPDGSFADLVPDEMPPRPDSLRLGGPRADTKGLLRSQSPLIDASRTSHSRNPSQQGPDRLISSQPYGTSPQRMNEGSRSSPSPWGPRNESLAGATSSSPPFGPAPPSRQGTGDLPHRGDCKACGLAIQGKSISSADGRLTGKYHKACFVCTSCAEPFASAEFYVHGDKPYCEQHYHKLNGSLCGGCRRGIEGRFVADESSIKYHVGCFCCLDCGRPLTDGYFEVDGRSYCEQDAWSRVNAPPPPSKQGGYPPPQDPYGYRQSPPPGARGTPPPPRRGPMPPRPPPGHAGLPGRPGPRPKGAGPPPSQFPPRGSSRSGRPPPPGMPHPKNGLSGLGPRPQMNKRTTRIGMM